jgi:DNA-binding LacI/PurR family transcriptional regulator
MTNQAAVLPARSIVGENASPTTSPKSAPPCFSKNHQPKDDIPHVERDQVLLNSQNRKCFQDRQPALYYSGCSVMPPLHFPSVTEQVARHLREELHRGTWTETIPGRNKLVERLGVSGKTVELALQQLEKEGLLARQGAGRQRRIIHASIQEAPSKLRIALLLPNKFDRGDDFIVELRHLLEEAGHTPFFPDKTLIDLEMSVSRVSRYSQTVRADIWIIAAGSREILEWFSAQPVPTFALFGRRGGLPIASAGPDKTPALTAATRRLLELGHRRITLLCREQRRLPQPGRLEQAFLDELISAGIQTSKFHLPDWDESRKGFSAILKSLFGPTPPTALIVDEPFLFNAAYFFLSKRGLNIPEDVSLICTDNDPIFAWCQPSVAHIRWDYRPVVRRVVRWANNVSRGLDDRRQTLTKAQFIEGGTIGPMGINQP